MLLTTLLLCEDQHATVCLTYLGHVRTCYILSHNCYIYLHLFLFNYEQFTEVTRTVHIVHICGAIVPKFSPI
jgi:hypothetical protein